MSECKDCKNYIGAGYATLRCVACATGTDKGYLFEHNKQGRTLAIEQNDALKAQVAVLRGALEEVMGELICSDCKHYIIRPPDDHDGLRYFCFLTDKETEPECYCEEWQGRRIVAPKTIAHKALSSTPSEASERVQKLVEALEAWEK